MDMENIEGLMKLADGLIDNTLNSCEKGLNNEASKLGLKAANLLIDSGKKILDIKDLKEIEKIVKAVEELQKQYLEIYYKKNKYMNTIALEGIAATIEDLYIPLTLMGKRSCLNYYINENGMDIFQQYNKILIVDNQIMGKSTIVKYFSILNSQNIEKMPIIIELRSLNIEQSIEEYIQQEMTAIYNDFPLQDIKNLLNGGNFIICFDGFDEVAENERENVIKMIKNFVAKANNNIFVLTSREDSTLASFGEFNQFYIKRLSTQEAYQLIKKYSNIDKHPNSMKAGKELREKLEREEIWKQEQELINELTRGQELINRLIMEQKGITRLETKQKLATRLEIRKELINKLIAEQELINQIKEQKMINKLMTKRELIYKLNQEKEWINGLNTEIIANKLKQEEQEFIKKLIEEERAKDNLPEEKIIEKLIAKEKLTLEKQLIEELTKRKEIIDKLTKQEFKNILNQEDFFILTEFLGNPLMTSLLYQTYLEENLSNQKYILYQNIYEILYEKHHSTKNGYHCKKKSGLDIDEMKKVLSYLGWYFVKKEIIEKEEIKCTEVELINMIKKALSDAQFESRNIKEKDFLEDILYIVPFFMKEGIYYKWIYKSFSEYFAACCIYDDKSKEKIKEILSRSTEYYMNVLDFCFDMSKDIKNIIIHDIVEKFIQYYNSSYQNEYFKQFDTNLIKLKKGIEFWNDFIKLNVNKDNKIYKKSIFKSNKINNINILILLYKKEIDIFSPPCYDINYNITEINQEKLIEKVKKTGYYISYQDKDELVNSKEYIEYFTKQLLETELNIFEGKMIDYDKCVAMKKSIEEYWAAQKDIFD